MDFLFNIGFKLLVNSCNHVDTVNSRISSILLSTATSLKLWISFAALFKLKFIALIESAIVVKPSVKSSLDKIPLLSFSFNLPEASSTIEAPRIATPSGELISCATPATSKPRDAIFSLAIISF